MENLSFTYTRERWFPGFDKVTCKIDPKIMYDGKDTAFMTWGMLLLSGSDVNVGGYVSKSTDGGKTFGAPIRLVPMETVKDGIRATTGAVCAYYNRYHKKWLGVCFRAYYRDNTAPICVDGISVGEAYFTTFDPDRCAYDEDRLTKIPLPFETISAVPHGQIIEYENGDMLLSFYVTTRDMHKAGVLTVRYALTDTGLEIVRTGTLLRGDGYTRGLCEPSVTQLNGRYYLTLRTDEVGLLAVSDDGYTYSEPIPWRWDDGSVLENYNTMQRWIRHPRGLYLAYTRRGAHNDHVFRHRAPMFMARFDEDRLCLIRDSEVILVPEMGARLGNFSVTDVSEKEAWLTTAEWMQPAGCERFGSDNSLWIARIRWDS